MSISNMQRIPRMQQYKNKHLNEQMCKMSRETTPQRSLEIHRGTCMCDAGQCHMPSMSRKLKEPTETITHLLEWLKCETMTKC